MHTEASVRASAFMHVQVLDESTSALSLEGEEAIYKALTARCNCVVTVSHRPSLRTFHHQVLELDGSGGWELNDISSLNSRLTTPRRRSVRAVEHAEQQLDQLLN